MSIEMLGLPFLSVIIPTYNRRESLRKTLSGLAAQTFLRDRFEVIVVSDGSTDGTEEFLEEFRAAAPFPFTWLAQENSGPSRARNRGVEEAKGEVIVFLDDDVEPTPEFLASHAEHHHAKEQLAVIGPMLRDPACATQEPVWIAWEHVVLARQYENWRTGRWAGVGPNHFYSGNASVRREYLLQVGGFNETFNRQEDVELAYRLFRRCGVRFCFDPRAIGTHRPKRTLQSWLNVPYSYGRLDVVRARSGEASWDVIRNGYFRRNWMTRIIADISLSCDTFGALLQCLLIYISLISIQASFEKIAYDALSAVYNVRYLQGAQSEIGSYLQTRRLIWKGATV